MPSGCEACATTGYGSSGRAGAVERSVDPRLGSEGRCRRRGSAGRRPSQQAEGEQQTRIVCASSFRPLPAYGPTAVNVTFTTQEAWPLLPWEPENSPSVKPDHVSRGQFGRREDDVAHRVVVRSVVVVDQVGLDDDGVPFEHAQWEMVVVEGVVGALVLRPQVADVRVVRLAQHELGEREGSVEHLR